MTLAVSSIDSVVCVTNANDLSRSKSKLSHILNIFNQMNATAKTGIKTPHRPFYLGVSCMPDKNGVHAPANLPTSICTLVTSGPVASNTVKSRRFASSSTAFETPMCRKMTIAPSGTSSTLQQTPHLGVPNPQPQIYYEQLHDPDINGRIKTA